VGASQDLNRPAYNAIPNQVWKTMHHAPSNVLIDLCEDEGVLSQRTEQMQDLATKRNPETYSLFLVPILCFLDIQFGEPPNKDFIAQCRVFSRRAMTSLRGD